MGNMGETPTAAADRFLALLKPVERDLERYCRRLSWEPAEAADVLQNAVLRAFAAFDRYQEDASFRAWIFKIATREAFAMNRRHARIARFEFQIEPEELADLPGPGLAESPEPFQDTLEPSLAAGLRTLTDTERAVLLLRAIGELRYREISETLGIPIGSVMGNLSRARQKMRARLARPAPQTELLKEDGS